MRAFWFITLATVVGFAAPAHAQEAVYDPWEGMNRHIYAFNDALDRAVVEPVARVYRTATPGFFRAGVRNFLHNLNSPVIFANDVLQGEAKRAGTTAGRFVINSTIGVAGVFDVAQHAGLEKHDEDFGQTLGKWGVHPGPYLFLPIVGPSNVRDAAGMIVDTALNPLNWADFKGDDETRIGLAVLNGVSMRADLIDTIDEVRLTSIDPYVSIRSSYGFFRESAIRNGLRDVQQLPEFEAMPEMTTEPATPNSVGQPPVETPPVGEGHVGNSQ